MKIPDLVASANSGNSLKADITIVMPVFNQARIIVRNLEYLYSSLGLAARVIIIDDGSTDGTAGVIASHLRDLGDSATAVELYRFEKSQFETRCDAFGFSIAVTDFVIEVQADMRVSDKNFDQRLLRAMTSHPDVFAISGRGVEPIRGVLDYYQQTAGSERSRGQSLWQHIIVTLGSRLSPGLWRILKEFRSKVLVAKTPVGIENASNHVEKNFEVSGMAGFQDWAEELEDEKEFTTNRLWVGETVMRGPLIVDRRKYQELGGFDTSSFFQCFDDHDLVLRAAMVGYPSGYSPVRYFSPSADGTSRKPRSWRSEIVILRNLLKIASHRKKSALARLISGKLNAPPVLPHVRTF